MAPEVCVQVHSAQLDDASTHTPENAARDFVKVDKAKLRRSLIREAEEVLDDRAQPVPLLLKGCRNAMSTSLKAGAGW